MYKKKKDQELKLDSAIRYYTTK